MLNNTLQSSKLHNAAVKRQICLKTKGELKWEWAVDSSGGDNPCDGCMWRCLAAPNGDSLSVLLPQVARLKTVINDELSALSVGVIRSSRGSYATVVAHNCKKESVITSGWENAEIRSRSVTSVADGIINQVRLSFHRRIFQIQLQWQIRSVSHFLPSCINGAKPPRSRLFAEEIDELMNASISF